MSIKLISNDTTLKTKQKNSIVIIEIESLKKKIMLPTSIFLFHSQRSGIIKNLSLIKPTLK